MVFFAGIVTLSPLLRAEEGDSNPAAAANDAALQWLARHQSLNKEVLPGKEAGLWFEHAWSSECQDYTGPGKGGESSDALKFPGHCEADKSAKKEQAVPLEAHTFGVNGLAIFAYAGAGRSHLRGDFKPTIQRWLDVTCATLDENRKTDKHGAFIIPGNKSPLQTLVLKKLKDTPWTNGKERGVDHILLQQALQVLALNEIYAVSKDKTLKDYCVEATAALLATRAGGNGFWQNDFPAIDFKTYGQDTTQNGNFHTTIWAILALKTAKYTKVLPEAAARMETTEDRVFQDIRTAIEGATNADKCTFSYDKPTSEQLAETPSGLAAIALTSTQNWIKAMEQVTPYAKDISKKLSLDADDPLAACAALGKDQWGYAFWGQKDAKPGSEESRGRDQMLAYFTSLSLYAYGGNLWKKYAKVNTDWLIKNQQQGKKACSDGSWEPDRATENATEGLLVGPHGRVATTALNALQLQIYARYKRDTAGKK